jgi:two-component system repressor protein LuxO
VVLLAEFFLDHFAKRDGKAFTGLDPTAREALLAHGWPGNVRELQNAIQQAVVLTGGPLLTAAALTPGLRDAPATAAFSAITQPVERIEAPIAGEAKGGPPLLPLWKIEKDAITRTLETCGGDVQKAAVVLEVSASTIYRKLQVWQKEPMA